MSKKHGVTGPLSLKESSSQDILKSQILNDFLIKSNFFESLESSQIRERVLGKLNHLALQFCQGRIHTFGSYRLGVHQKNADIDTLLIAPSSFSHKDFFKTFYGMLEGIKEIEDLQKVEDAYVPLIKFKIQNVPIDLLFSRVNLSNLKNLNLLDDSLLKNMDEKSILSINGSRVTDMLIDLVPDVEVFHNTLRCIKYWAKRRGVYGNSYGYPGGVAFAISVARICQFYPKGCCYTILYKFFEVYSMWQWPEPVILTEIVDRNYNLKVWNNKVNPQDRYHKMPIITPAYPSMCSTHNVSNTTLGILISEYQRGLEILKECKEIDKIFVISNENIDQTKDLNKIGDIPGIESEKITESDLQISENNLQACKNKDEKICNENLINLQNCKNEDEKTCPNNLQVCKNKDEKMCHNNLNNFIDNQDNTDNQSFLNNNSSNYINKDEKNNLSTLNNLSSNNLIFKNKVENIVKNLFNPSDFFKKYKIYLRVIINDDSNWIGFIESKIRYLCAKLESAESYQTVIALSAVPFPQIFKKNGSASFFIGIDCKEKMQINLDRAVKNFNLMVVEWEGKKEEMKIEYKINKKNEIGKFLKDFYKIECSKRKNEDDDESIKKVKIDSE
ncbi:hypothetical protein GVAV_000014 [Gurleya vavrai]